MLFEFSGQARPGVGTGHEVRYQPISAAHGDLFSPVANPRVTLDRRLQHQAARWQAAAPPRPGGLPRRLPGDRLDDFAGEVRALLANRCAEGIFWDWPGDTEVVMARKPG
jgi:hypothetical protein